MTDRSAPEHHEAERTTALLPLYHEVLRGLRGGICQTRTDALDCPLTKGNLGDTETKASLTEEHSTWDSQWKVGFPAITYSGPRPLSISVSSSIMMMGIPAVFWRLLGARHNSVFPVYKSLILVTTQKLDVMTPFYR